MCLFTTWSVKSIVRSFLGRNRKMLGVFASTPLALDKSLEKEREIQAKKWLSEGRHVAFGTQEQNQWIYSN